MSTPTKNTTNAAEQPESYPYSGGWNWENKTRGQKVRTVAGGVAAVGLVFSIAPVMNVLFFEPAQRHAAAAQKDGHEALERDGIRLSPTVVAKLGSGPLMRAIPGVKMAPLPRAAVSPSDFKHLTPYGKGSNNLISEVEPGTVIRFTAKAPVIVTETSGDDQNDGGIPLNYGRLPGTGLPFGSSGVGAMTGLGGNSDETEQVSYGDYEIETVFDANSIKNARKYSVDVVATGVADGPAAVGAFITQKGQIDLVVDNPGHKNIGLVAEIVHN